MKHELQDKWDEKIILSFNQNSIAAQTFSFFAGIHVEKPSDFGAEIERLRSEGLMRLPILNKGNESQWFFVFSKMPVSVWAARAFPNCIDRFLGKSFEEKVKILKSYKTKRIGYSAKDRKRERNKKVDELGGGKYKILVRNRDHRTTWNYVK